MLTHEQIVMLEQTCLMSGPINPDSARKYFRLLLDERRELLVRIAELEVCLPRNQVNPEGML